MNTVVFIDGNYLYKLVQRLELQIDFKNLRQALMDYFDSGPVRFYYYYCTPLNYKDGHVAAKPLIDWLGYNGYIIRHRAIPIDHIDTESRGYVATAMSVDALSIDKQSTFVFMIGNPELLTLINACSVNHYTVLLNYDGNNLHQDLQKAADLIVDLKELSATIDKPIFTLKD